MSNQSVTNAIVTERLQIIDYLRRRIEDFTYCSKDDCCEDHAYVLSGIIEDIENEEHYGKMD